MADFTDFLDALSDDVFEEMPVDLNTFLYDKNFMRLPPLSLIQEEVIERGSQIYKEETLIKLYGPEKGKDIWEKKTTVNMLLMLGKGSGKDFVSRIICAYSVYKLLCLRDPAAYFGKPSGDAIDIVNMAINARQAINVFFNGLLKDIKNCAWFAGKFSARANDIKFDKEVTVHSLHSSYEAAEGLNIMIAVLDEIDGFETEGQADKIYDALYGTVSSRYPDVGKVICLSFPRTKDGFMMRTYNDAVIDKTVEQFSHTFKLNEDLPDGIVENEFTVTWTEDSNLGYKYSNFFALKAPTFRVNPTRHIEDYKMPFYKDFQKDTQDTLMRVCANPPDHDSTSFFKNHAKLEKLFAGPNGWHKDELQLNSDFGNEYYIHVDLSKVSDRCVVAMGHVSAWQAMDLGAQQTTPRPFITVDLFRVWEPTRADPVDHGQVRDFIVSLSHVFNVKKVTFDQWGSFDMIEYLNNVGVIAEKNSLAREEYQEFLTVVGEERLDAPYDERLLRELKHLIITPTGKVDHPKGADQYNDISEAVCGVINNCIENARESADLQIVDLTSLRRDRLRDEAEIDSVFSVANREMPDDIRKFLDGLGGV